MRSLTDLAGDLTVPTEQVLTTLRIVATRARVDELGQWAAKELEGYDDDDELPKHRRWQISIEATLIDPRMLLSNVHLPETVIDEKIREKVTVFRCTAGIGQLERMVADHGAGEALGAEHPNLAMLVNSGRGLGPGVQCLQAYGKFSAQHIRSVVDRARQTALTLCLGCEDRDIELRFVEATDSSTAAQEHKTWMKTLREESTRTAIREAWRSAMDFFNSGGCA